MLFLILETNSYLATIVKIETSSVCVCVCYKMLVFPRRLTIKGQTIAYSYTVYKSLLCISSLNIY